MNAKTYRSSDDAFGESVRDLKLTLRNWRLPLLLSWRETKNRYRRSFLGPFWMTLTMAFRIGALALIFSTLFKQPIDYYLIWVTAGFVSWEFISGTLNASGEWFSSRAGYIVQGQTTLGSLVIWGMMSQILTMLHALPLCFIVCWITKFSMNWNLLYLPIGIAMLCFALIPAGLVLGILVPRLRDVGPLIGSLLQVAFYITPIMWLPEPTGITHVVTVWNPFSYMVDWLRKPIVGEPLEMIDFLFFSALMAVLVPIALLIFVRYRRRLAYWI